MIRQIRMIFDGRYKFSRYFLLMEPNNPSNLDRLYANNNIELFDLQTDPKEIKNLSAVSTRGTELAA